MLTFGLKKISSFKAVSCETYAITYKVGLVVDKLQWFCTIGVSLLKVFNRFIKNAKIRQKFSSIIVKKLCKFLTKFMQIIDLISCFSTLLFIFEIICREKRLPFSVIYFFTIYAQMLLAIFFTVSLSKTLISSLLFLSLRHL